MRIVGDGMQEMVPVRAWDKFLFSQYGTESICGENYLMLRTLDHTKVYESGVVVTAFLDGTEIEYRKEER